MKPAARPIHILRSNSGMSIILVLIMVSIITIAVSGVLLQTQQLHTFANNLETPIALQQVRDNVEAVLDNDGAWFKTVQNNPSLACLKNLAPNPNATCPAAAYVPISLFEADGTTVFVDGAVGSTQGFQLDGTICNTFGVAGDVTCIFQYQISWQCVLQTGVCPQTSFKAGSIVAATPAINITATLVISPNVTANYSRTNLAPFSIVNPPIQRGQIDSTISKLCNSLPGGVYSQASKNCLSSFSYNDGTFDCTVILGPHSWFGGFDNNGLPVCVRDQKAMQYCMPGHAVLGIDAQGNILCGTY